MHRRVCLLPLRLAHPDPFFAARRSAMFSRAQPDCAQGEQMALVAALESLPQVKERKEA